MVKKSKSKSASDPPSFEAAAGEGVTGKVAPKPLHRAIKREQVKSGLIKVRANRPIGEMDANGNMQRYVKGDVFYIDAERARALGNQVTQTEG